MGSYLSVENTTEDVWYVNVGTDTKALSIAGIVGSAIGAVATVVLTTGAAAPLFAALEANGVVGVFGISTTGLTAITGGAASLGGLASAAAVAASGTGATVTLSNYIQKHLEDQGMVRLEPGQKHSWGKMSLSLWQQGTCIRTRINPKNPMELLIDTLYMRPIFSGPTAGSTNNHTIQYWLNKNGVETQAVAVAKVVH